MFKLVYFCLSFFISTGIKNATGPIGVQFVISTWDGCGMYMIFFFLYIYLFFQFVRNHWDLENSLAGWD